MNQLTQQTRVPNRLMPQALQVELARYRDLALYVPKIGDFIIWHGWWSRWYGLLIDLNNDDATIIKENLPKLLFTIPESERKKYSFHLSVDRIRCSRGGEYHVLQENVWYMDV